MATLAKNQLVVFENGEKADWTQAVWSEKHKAFCIATDDTDENGRRIMLFSNNVIEKPAKKSRNFIPGPKSCTVKIYPLGETENAYQVEDGTNGKIGHSKEYYKYIAKSVCYKDENGNIYAPAWA